MDISNSNIERIAQLIEICKEHQGEHLDSHHGSGSWATSYSVRFIDASEELYSILEKSGDGWPIYTMSRYFKDAGILSCRRRVMSIDKVEYLYNKYLAHRLHKKS